MSLSPQAIGNFSVELLAQETRKTQMAQWQKPRSVLAADTISVGSAILLLTFNESESEQTNLRKLNIELDYVIRAQIAPCR